MLSQIYRVSHMKAWKLGGGLVLRCVIVKVIENNFNSTARYEESVTD